MKKFLCIISTFSFLSTALEKPYEPSFTAKHPKLIQRARSTGAGIAASALTYAGLQMATTQDSSTSLKYSLAVGVASGVAAYYLKPVTISLFDTVLCHPDQALLYAYQVNKQMNARAQQEKVDDIQDATEKCTKFSQIIKHFEARCPFILLGECTDEGFGPCVLSRSYQKKYRNVFEDAIGKFLTQKSSPGKPIVYASFGCGGIFQDLVTLTKFFCKNPGAQIDIHLIDQKHMPLVACCDFLNERRIHNEPINYTQVLPQLIEKGRKEWGGDKYSEETVRGELSNNITYLDLKHKELLNWLQTNFPKSSIRLFSHESAQSYLAFIEKNNLEYPDIIHAVDIQDEMSQLRHSINHYLTLCAKTLEKKPDSINILLAKMLEKKGYRVSLLTCTKDNAQGSTEAPYTDFEKQEQKIYYSEKNL